MQSVVERLCAVAGRGACTDAERRAALWLHDELRSRGHEAWVETRWVRPQRYATVAFGCLAAVAGSLLSTVAAAPGLAVAVAGTAVLALHAAGWALPLFPRRATQHVLTDAPDALPVLIIVAAYDAPRRGLVLNDRWRRRLRPRWGLAACGIAVAGAAGARLGGVEETWLGAAALLPTVVLLVAFAAAIDIALSGFSPGANDNASGVAVALALFDELRRRPPRALAPALLLTGAGHAVPRTVAAHLRAERIRGVVLELGPCGSGPPAWAAGHPQLRAAAGRAAQALGAAEGGRRSAGVRIAGSDTRAHQADDTPEHVSRTAMEAALDLALGVVDALDAELSADAPATSPPA
jgi:hypothetical protein